MAMVRHRQTLLRADQGPEALEVAVAIYADYPPEQGIEGRGLGLQILVLHPLPGQDVAHRVIDVELGTGAPGEIEAAQGQTGQVPAPGPTRFAAKEQGGEHPGGQRQRVKRIDDKDGCPAHRRHQ